MRTHAAILLLLGALLGTLAGCNGRQGDDALAQARSALARHEGDAAVVLLKQWLQQHPDSGEGRLLLGQLLLDRHDAAAALIELGKAGELGQPPDLTTPAMARALLERGEPDRVLQQFAGTSLDEAAAQADLSTSVATAHFALRQPAAGEAALRRALAAAPDHLPARLLQVRRVAAGGDRAAALALLDQAGPAAARDPAAWTLRGYLLATPPATPADAASAVVAYRQALQYGADVVQGHAAILTLLIAQKDLAAAEQTLAQLRKLQPQHPQTLYFGAVLALHRGDTSAARSAADKLLAGAPTHPAYQRLAGTAALEAGDLPRATTLLSNALQSLPGDKPLRRLMTLALVRSGEAARALATVQPLLGAQPPDAEAMALAAMAELQHGQPARAKALFVAASRLAPDDPTVRRALAMGRLASGDGEAGLAELQRLAAVDAGTEADIALIRAHLQRLRWAPALAAIDALARKPPGALPARMLRGELEVRRGDLAAARAQFDQAVQLVPSHLPATAALAELDLLQQRPADARARFDALLAQQPRHAAALIARAVLGARTGQPADEAVRLLGQAIEAEPGQPDARLLLIDHHLAQGRPKAALDEAGKAVLALPEDPRLQDALARATLAAGDLSQAARAYTRLAAMQPGDPAPLLGLARAQLALKDPEAARRAIHLALKAQPGSVAALGALVRLELALKRPKEAAAAARQVQTLHPADPQGDVLEAEVLVQQQAWAGAEAAYGRALRKRGDAGAAARGLHRLLLNQGKVAEAKQLAADWTRDHPGDIAFLVHLGEDSLARGDLGAAEAGLMAVLKRRPDDAQVLNNLAWVGLKLGRDAALAQAERACALRPDMPTYLDTLAQLQARARQLDQALATQRRAIALAPEDGQLRLTLARLYAEAGERAKAVAELDRLAALGDRFAGQAQVARLRQSL